MRPQRRGEEAVVPYGMRGTSHASHSWEGRVVEFPERKISENIGECDLLTTLQVNSNPVWFYRNDGA